MMLLYYGFVAISLIFAMTVISRTMRLLVPPFIRWIRSKSKRKDWHKPFMSRWPVYEGGELVECNGRMYVILHPSLRIAGRPAGGLGGPASYLALNSFGVMESINNWETRRLQ